MGLSPSPSIRTTRSRTASMVSQSRPSEDKKSVSPRSTTENRPLSRNAQAQARLRARRRAYVESLEAEVKRLQGIVDATALHPGRGSHTSTSTSGSSPLGAYSSPTQSFSSNLEPVLSTRPLEPVQQLRSDNDRLRRERDAYRVQVEALMGYVSRGCALPPVFPNPNSMSNVQLDSEGLGLVSRETEQGHSPTPGSEMDSEGRQSPSHDLFSPSPLIQPGAYTKDEA
ncbi:hypothetical protein FRC11_008949, partial [Ceratobasidium sp. 423]